jgi:hypothetical protein
LNNGKNSKGKQLDAQAKSLTQRLVSEFWACQPDCCLLGDRPGINRAGKVQPRSTFWDLRFTGADPATVDGACGVRLDLRDYSERSTSHRIGVVAIDISQLLCNTPRSVGASRDTSITSA